MKKVFDQAGDFSACDAAEQWCKENGVSVGSMQRGDPRGLMRGDVRIAKWRNLGQADKDALDGQMTGDMRNGPVTVLLNDVAAQ